MTASQNPAPRKFALRTSIATALGAVLLTTLLVACSDDAASDEDSISTTTLGVVENLPGDIVQVASTTDGFTTLVQAVAAAGLVETLQGTGPFTVFAPSDDAFAALADGLLDKLLLEENREILVSILTYHVVAGKVTSAEVASGAATTVEGSNIELTVGNGIQVNGANVVLADVEASNGVIHVIDQVLIPPTVDVSKL
ncbi:MAG: fasciclin domain-containing protein [Ilumatobacteraceae bacterium]